MRTGSTTAEVLRAERGRIALTYGVTLLENLFYLAYPWTIGLAIDGLLSGKGPWSLAPLIAIWGLHILIGAGRQVYDTWVFARVHAEIAAGTIVRQRAAGMGTTEIAARSVMSRELVDFLEREVPTLATAALGLVGGIAMLFWYDRLVGLVVTALMVPVLAVYTVMGRRAHRLNKDLNDETEREVDLISRGRLGPLASHFRRRGRLRVRLSNAEAASYVLLNQRFCSRGLPLSSVPIGSDRHSDALKYFDSPLSDICPSSPAAQQSADHQNTRDNAQSEPHSLRCDPECHEGTSLHDADQRRWPLLVSALARGADFADMRDLDGRC